MSATDAITSLTAITSNGQSEPDVARDVEVREQLLVLEHQTKTPAVRRHVGDVVIVEEDPTVIRDVQAGDDSQEGRLSGTARPKQAHDLASIDGDRNGVEHGPVAESNRDLVNQ